MNRAHAAMFSALLYLQFVSLKNRLVMRIKRLKQPKYLVGAIVGGLYLYFYVFRWMFAGRFRHHQGSGPDFELDPMLLECFGGLVLLVIALLAWVLPHQRAALTFTEAEVAFLFPAPVTRRTLIHFKLMRSQFAILFTVIFLTLIFGRGGGHPFLRAAGWWVILMTLNLHFLGSSFALTMLMDRGISTWKRRIAILTLGVIGVGIVVVWTLHAIPELKDENLKGVEAMLEYAKQALVAGPLQYLLFPFRLVVRPYLAKDALAFLNVLWPALLIMGAHYWWVIRSDVAFEEASVEASRKLAERVAAVRAGRWQHAHGQKLKPKRSPFKLAPAGLQPVALLWKNLVAAGQAFSTRTWMVLLWLTVAAIFAARSFGHGSNWLPVAGGIAAMIGAWAVLIGPQILRHDLRQDIQLADQLKLYPMRGWQVALGEILAPAAILTAAQWLLLLLATSLLAMAGLHKVSPGLVIAIGIGAAMVIPMLNLISLIIPNAAVLLFPAWFQTGKDSPHGIEATGQRLIYAIGQFLAFAVSLIPAAAVFIGVLLLVKYAVGLLPAIPAASLAAAVVLAVEAAFGMMWLGWLFERFDVTSEPQT